MREASPRAGGLWGTSMHACSSVAFYSWLSLVLPTGCCSPWNCNMIARRSQQFLVTTTCMMCPDGQFHPAVRQQSLPLLAVYQYPVPQLALL
ncbi:hypothetical protein COO60DRAFT_35802 [Scenedesmus sp. NREL 46B-D3]|nr:hypothetical protein COO60DRAFT_35802 [Scenedesmus sp. NREL 46B-D3]